MRQRKFAGLLAVGLMSLIGLHGCGGNDPDYGTPKAPAFVPAAGIAPPRFAYVVNRLSNNVSGFTVNAATGVLTRNASPSADPTPLTSPWSTGGTGPVSIAVDASVQFAYVVNAGSNSISVFSIASTGALTRAGSTLPTTGNGPKSVAVDPLGRYVYVVNNGDSTISGYSRNSSTGLLTPISSTPSTGGIDSSAVAIDPAGKFVYVTNFGNSPSTGSVTIFSIGSGGALASVGSINVAYPSSIAISPSGLYAYVTNYNGDNVSFFDINATTGGLSQRGSTTVVSGATTPTAIAVEPNGKYAYVSFLSASGSSTGVVGAYQINQSANAGSLMPVSGTGAFSTLSSTGNDPESVSADPSGNFVYVVQQAGGVINPFKIVSTPADATAGHLTSLASAATETGTSGSIFILITK